MPQEDVEGRSQETVESLQAWALPGANKVNQQINGNMLELQMHPTQPFEGQI